MIDSLRVFFLSNKLVCIPGFSARLRACKIQVDIQ